MSLPNAYLDFSSEADNIRFIFDNTFLGFLYGPISFDGRKETHLFAAFNPLRRPPAVPYIVDETAKLAVVWCSEWHFMVCGKSDSSSQYSGGR